MLCQGISGSILYGILFVFYFKVVGQIFFCYVSGFGMVNDLICYVIQECKSLQIVEGKVFLDFQWIVFDGLRECLGENEEDIYLIGFENLVEWVFSLFGYYELVVGVEVEQFL